MNKASKVNLELLKWFQKNGRKFPWRRKNISFYKLLACEIFLWKTQASMVSAFIDYFFKKYPTPNTIDRTPMRKISKEIKTLGLSNRRARLLKKTFLGYSDKNIPRTEKEFRKRFKIGQYIARSVLSIYYNQKLFPIDQNIYRFFKRVFDYKIKNLRKIPPGDELFLKNFYSENSKKLIWAIIDFASLICKSRNPACYTCLLNRYCVYYHKIQ